MNLYKLGFDNYFEEHFKEFLDKGYYAARVIAQQKNNYLLCSEKGVINGKLSGKFRYNSNLKKDFPAVGDWVVIRLIQGVPEEAIIHFLLPRKSSFVRKMAISGGRKIKNGIIVGGNIEEQVIASNIDTAFIVTGLDGNFNLQRIERYITLAYNSGATPVILLSKVDLCNNIDSYVNKVETIAIGLNIHPISVMENTGMNIFDNYLTEGKTVVFLGSSGVGKSTIINHLFGEIKQKTNSISSANGKGRHTTTSAQLFCHSSGSMIIDTPGIRELQLWGDEDILENSFQDIYDLAEECRFKDCKHTNEPGCAIKAAIEDGMLSIERFESYQKQLGEFHRLGINKRKCGAFVKKNLQRMGLQ